MSDKELNNAAAKQQRLVVKNKKYKKSDIIARTISATYTLSLGERSNLRKMLESWRSRAFTPEELQGFDLEKVFAFVSYPNWLSGLSDVNYGILLLPCFLLVLCFIFYSGYIIPALYIRQVNNLCKYIIFYFYRKYDTIKFNKRQVYFKKYLIFY